MGGKSCLNLIYFKGLIMAFNRNSNAQRNTDQNTGGNEWRAQGFLNLYLPSKDGGRRKLGAIPLKDSKTNERDLRAWLEADPSHIQIFINKLEVEYQPAAQAEGSTFDLSTPANSKD
jgi:hypothetical protein